VAIDDAAVTIATRGPGAHASAQHPLHIIAAMTRLSRLPLHVRAPLALLCTTLLLWSGIPVALFPLLAMDAGHYRTAITDPAARCSGDPIPARNGCWSATSARVVVTGVDQLDSGTVAYAVVEVPGRDAVREDFVDSAHADTLAADMHVTVRYWGSNIVDVAAAAPLSAARVLMPTRDNPSYRAAHFPWNTAVVAAMALAGVVLFAVPLMGDARRWRQRRRLEIEAEAAGRLAISTHGLARGLERYDRTPSRPETALTGWRTRDEVTGCAAPRPSPTAGPRRPPVQR
jgi:hypothetical protein